MLRRPITVAPLLVVLLVLTSGCGGPSSSAAFTGTRVDPPFTASSTPLTDEDGQPFSLHDDLDTRLTLVFFGYTHCPDICPTVLASVASALQRLDPDERAQVKLEFVTSDPERDSPAVMRRYLDHFDESFAGLTGSLTDIAEVAKSLGVFVDVGSADPDGRVDPNSHGTYVIGLDRDGTAPVFWGQETSPHEFATDFATLLD